VRRVGSFFEDAFSVAAVDGGDVATVDIVLADDGDDVDSISNFSKVVASESSGDGDGAFEHRVGQLDSGVAGGGLDVESLRDPTRHIEVELLA